ncbi:MAG: VOC family protein [Chloroflexi bacterium]|nr:VOC family protein [Chloroflexota bacterium]
MSIRIAFCSISIADTEYDKALDFYTTKLGFVKKHDIPLGGGARWLTVVSPDDPNGTEVVLEPNASYPAMKALKEALVKDGVPCTAFEVQNVQAEYERLKALGVDFIMEPTNTGMSIQAILDDTCGNYIQIFQMVAG